MNSFAIDLDIVRDLSDNSIIFGACKTKYNIF